jgi:hypothetical protein
MACSKTLHRKVFPHIQSFKHSEAAAATAGAEEAATA